MGRLIWIFAGCMLFCKLSCALIHKSHEHGFNTVMILSFRTDMPGQTVQTQRSSLIRVYTVCHSVCIVWTHYSMVKPHSSNFRVITRNFLGVRIFRKFTVPLYLPVLSTEPVWCKEDVERGITVNRINVFSCQPSQYYCQILSRQPLLHVW